MPVAGELLVKKGSDIIDSLSHIRERCLLSAVDAHIVINIRLTS